MKFITVRDLRSRTAAIRKELATERDMVVTANGRPFALLAAVEPDTVETDILAIRRARFLATLDRIQAWSKAKGLDKLTMPEIDAIIAKAREERKRKARRRA
ncbi:MAG: type II toxin-antitoxin system Phd/YefM family antitoxin [Planctomycetes bacterium]|nr:type II toxin-antitoxin system Phd/YefM family antitoxin [Planctomycetota bacterium]